MTRATIKKHFDLYYILISQKKNKFLFFVAALVICLFIKFRFPKGKSIARIIEVRNLFSCGLKFCNVLKLIA